MNNPASYRNYSAATDYTEVNTFRLSREVNEACDKFFESRGMKKSLRQIFAENAKLDIAKREANKRDK